MPVELVRYKDYRGKPVTAKAEELLAQAKDDPAFLFPYPFLYSMLHPEERPQHRATEVSVTHVIKGCTSCKVLQAYEPYTLDLDAGLRAWRGTQFHALMEQCKVPEDITETRFWARVPGTEYVVHGKPDIIRLLPVEEGAAERRARLIDLKTTQSVPTWDTPWSDHVEQCMDYTWLVRHSYRNDLAGSTDQANLTSTLPDYRTPLVAGMPECFDAKDLQFESVMLWYIADKNGDLVFKPLEVRKKTEVATGKGAKYPTRTVKEPVVWSDEEIEALLVPKVVAHCEAMLQYEEDGTLPDYPRGFDFIGDFSHKYSPVAAECVRRHLKAGQI